MAKSLGIDFDDKIVKDYVGVAKRLLWVGRDSRKVPTLLRKFCRAGLTTLAIMYPDVGYDKGAVGRIVALMEQADYNANG